MQGLSKADEHFGYFSFFFFNMNCFLFFTTVNTCVISLRASFVRAQPALVGGLHKDVCIATCILMVENAQRLYKMLYTKYKLFSTSTARSGHCAPAAHAEN